MSSPLPACPLPPIGSGNAFRWLGRGRAGIHVLTQSVDSEDEQQCLGEMEAALKYAKELSASWVPGQQLTVYCGLSNRSAVAGKSSSALTEIEEKKDCAFGGIWYPGTVAMLFVRSGFAAGKRFPMTEYRFREHVEAVTLLPPQSNHSCQQTGDAK